VLSLDARAWEEQRVLELVMVNNPVVRAQRTVTNELTPPSGVMARMKEYTLAYGRAGVGGTDFLSGEDEPFVLQAGIQISIPLAVATCKHRAPGLQTSRFSAQIN